MSNLIVWTNNASSLLASGISNSATSVTVTAGQGALFPAIAAGQYSVATLEDTSGNIEVVYVTGRASDTMTITRAQEGTTALAFASGSRFELRVTAGVLATLLQKTGSDILTGTTTLGGVLSMNGSGSIQNGEIAGAAIRGAPGVTGNQILVPSNGTSPATMAASPILTTANLLGNLPAGAGLNITGMVLFWSGASNAIPAGYVLCDGTNGTPDMRDQFVVGGGGALPSSGGSNPGVTGSTSLSGLSISGTALTLDQIPGHTHQYWASSQIDFGGASGSPIQTVGSGGSYTTNIPNGTGVPVNQQFIQWSGGSSQGTQSAANTHTHTVGGTTSHNHTITLPPYRALFAIMKT